jgi:hypothetical protein
MDNANVTRLFFARQSSADPPMETCARGIDRESVKRKLEAWAEEDFIQNCSATYASFQPAPRSTIALSFNCDGTLLASTQ